MQFVIQMYIVQNVWYPETFKVNFFFQSCSGKTTSSKEDVHVPAANMSDQKEAENVSVLFLMPQLCLQSYYMYTYM